MKTVHGDLIQMAYDWEFDVIGHGCNCFCVQKAGIAKQMVKHFGTDYEGDIFSPECDFLRGNIHKLGTIYSNTIDMPYEDGNFSLTVVNMYTQYGYGTDKVHLDYEALTLCLRKMNHVFKGKRVGLPLVGGGLAGGDEKRIKKIMEDTMTDVDFTLVLYKK